MKDFWNKWITHPISYIMVVALLALGAFAMSYNALQTREAKQQSEQNFEQIQRAKTLAENSNRILQILKESDRYLKENEPNRARATQRIIDEVNAHTDQQIAELRRELGN